MKRIAYIDGGELCFKAALHNSASVDWGDGAGKVVTPRPLPECIAKAAALIAEWKEEARADSVVIAMSSPVNFRRKLLPTYKPGGVKPEHHAGIERHLRDTYETVELFGLEADDVLGLESIKEGEVRIIVSSDKDMLTLPGARVIRPTQGLRATVSPIEADVWWMTQTLAGDPSDGYKGCPRIGPVKAAAILAGRLTIPEMWAAVVRAYEAAKLSHGDALIQARVSRILRPGDYRPGELRLWHPTYTNWTPLEDLT